MYTTFVDNYKAVVCIICVIVLFIIFGNAYIPHFGQMNKSLLCSKPKKRMPSAIIIGVQKGGTKALKDFLELNSRIQITPKGEMHFFGRDDYASKYNWYLSMMPKSCEGDFTIEKSPSYFPNPKVPQRIKDFDPNIKLIVIFRNPVERAISNWAHNFAHHIVKKNSYNTSFLYPNGTVNPNAIYIDQGLYAYHMKNWYDRFPKRNILILDGDKFTRNPIPTLNKVEDFLGVNREIPTENVVYSKDKKFFCKKYKRHLQCQPARKGRPHPDIGTDLYQKLDSFFKPHNKEFLELVGMNLSGIR